MISGVRPCFVTSLDRNKRIGFNESTTKLI